MKTKLKFYRCVGDIMGFLSDKTTAIRPLSLVFERAACRAYMRSYRLIQGR